MLYNIEHEDGSVTENVYVPSHFEVCPACMGHGTRDCWDGGMTGDEMAEQGPEFFEDYMAGVYSIPCTECNGQRVVEVITYEQLSPELRKMVEHSEEMRREYEAEREHEYRMGY